MIALVRHEVLAGARDVRPSPRSRAHVPPKSFGIRSRMSMLSRPTYGAASRNATSPSLHVQQRPRRAPAVEHEVVDAVHADERREVVAGVRVQQHAGLGRPRRGVAARRAGDDAGQHAGAEDQRDVGMQRLQRFVEQAVQIEHVGAAPGEQRARRPAAACSRAAPRAARDRRRPSRPASGYCGRLRQLGHQTRHAIADRHQLSVLGAAIR